MATLHTDSIISSICPRRVTQILFQKVRGEGHRFTTVNFDDDSYRSR